MFTRLEERVGSVAGAHDVADLADVWLLHALAALLDGWGVPEEKRRELTAAPAAGGEAVRLEHLDSCRTALVFAALAVEARLNRVLRSRDGAEWRTVAHLMPAERFRLAPRLLDELESATKDAELVPLVVKLFEYRDELVDAGESPGSALTDAEALVRFGPSHARAMVEASAKVCAFLATLTGEESGIAQLVQNAAEQLARQAHALEAVAPSWSFHEVDWAEFPPDLVGS